MSVNASQLELLQLIHRHLKEFGFDSAANELQRHNPQGDCSVSASLLDIYSSWLNDPKRKTQSASSKSPSSKKKGRTPEKNSKFKAVNQANAKNECSSESEELSQSLLPQTPLTSCHATPVRTPQPMTEKPAVLTPAGVKQKKSGKDLNRSTDKVKAVDKKRAKSPKSKGSTESATGTSAKKKVKTLTKTEIAKKKSGPGKRKTPAGKDEANASKAKKGKTQMNESVSPVQGDDSDSDSSLDVEKWKKLVLGMTDADVVKMDVINALDSSSVQPKRRRARKPAASKDTKPPGEEQNLGEGKNTSNTPAISSTPKRSRTSTPAPVKTLADPHQEESSNSVKDQPAASTVQNSCGVPLSEELTNGAPAEPKKKKKRKKEAKEDKQMEEEVKKDGETEDQTVIVQHEEVPDSVVSEEKREKKAKKKKKEQSEREGGQVISEQLPEVTSEASDPLVSAKKKKKKSKSNADGPEATLEESKIIPVEIPGEHSLMVNKEDETNKSDLQDLSEQISKKKKRRKDKADRGTLELADKESSEMADVNGNDQPTDAAPLPPVTPQTEKKKKKKSKLHSAEAPQSPQTPGPGSEETSHPEVLFQPLSVIHKKKKKHKTSSSKDV